MPTVLIPPEHFARRVANEYSDPVAALWRELFQNSLDAGATILEIQVDADSYRFSDNGRGMSYETMRRGLLTLGGSVKDGEASTGGYGIAKELILFAHKQYTVHSNRVGVEGVVATYKRKEIEPRRGTMIEARVDANSNAFWGFKNRSSEAIRRLVGSSKLHPDLQVFLNGEPVACRSVPEEALNRQVRIGKLYASAETPTCAVVRVNGLVMFRQANEQLPQTIILDLDPQHSREYLTSNRDGIKYEHAREWNDLLTRACIDRRSFNHRSEGEVFVKGAKRHLETPGLKSRAWADKLGLLTSARTAELVLSVVAGAQRAAASSERQVEIMEKVARGEDVPDDPRAQSLVSNIRKAVELSEAVDAGSMSQDAAETTLLDHMAEQASAAGDRVDLKAMQVFVREMLTPPVRGFAADSYIFNSTDPVEMELIYGRAPAVLRLEQMWQAAVEAAVQSNTYADRKFRIGWEFDAKREASYTVRNGVAVFSINPLTFLTLDGKWKPGVGPGRETKLRLAVLAAHELCHQKQEYHDEEFVSLLHVTLENTLHRLLGEHLSAIRLGPEPRSSAVAEEDQENMSRIGA